MSKLPVVPVYLFMTFFLNVLLTVRWALHLIKLVFAYYCHLLSFFSAFNRPKTRKHHVWENVANKPFSKNPFVSLLEIFHDGWALFSDIKNQYNGETVTRKYISILILNVASNNSSFEDPVLLHIFERESNFQYHNLSKVCKLKELLWS